MDSILTQLADTDELIISDDNSTDNTCAIISAYNDQRIKLLHHTPKENEPHKRIVLNMEHALLTARGDFIFLADQDDVWRPDKKVICLKVLTKSDLVLSNCEIINEEGKQIYPSYFQLRPPAQNMLGMLAVNPFMGCCMAFRREVLNKALPFPKGIPMYDWWIGLVAKKYFQVEILPLPLVYYRRHGGNKSTTTGRSNMSIISQAFIRIKLAFALLKK